MPGQRPQEHDRWASGDAYEAYVGRWSRDVAGRFVSWLSVAADSRWIDVGCGTGALSLAIFMEQSGKADIVGVDPSRNFLATAIDWTTTGRNDFVMGTGVDLPVRSGAADVAVSGLVLNFVPDPGRMVAEMARVVRPGGRVALYVWDYAGEMQMMRHFWDAAVELDPSAARFDEGMRFSICKPDALAGLFADAGLADIQTRAIDIDTMFRDFDDYWIPFLGGTGTAPGYVASLDEKGRNALRERLRERLPVDANGGIRLIARANAIRGVRA